VISKLDIVQVGALQTNCYLISSGQKLLIIDPGAEPQKISQLIEQNKFIPQAIINTHGHYDHVGGNRYLAENFQIPIYLQAEDIPMQRTMAEFYGTESFNVDNDAVLPVLQDFGLNILLSPGHSEGGITLYNEQYVFTGDTVFAGGYLGRTDFPGGSDQQIQQSLQKILLLPGGIIYPGHGPASTIERERRYHG